MSDAGPPEGGNPFEGWPMFKDLAGLFSSQGPVNWDMARHTSQWIAAEGAAEANVAPLERFRIEELLRVADLHVGEATGLSTSVAGGVLTVLPVTRANWAIHSLETYRPFLDRLARSLADAPRESESPSDAATQLLGDLGKILGPGLLGIQSGYMVGHLARRSLGQYDLPIPRAAADQVLMVPANIDALVAEWSLPPDDVRMWVCLREVAYHAVLGRPHVDARLRALIGEYVTTFEVSPGALDESLEHLDPTDPSAFQAVLGNPETLLGAVQSDAQRQVGARIQDLTAVIAGYADHVVDQVGRRLIASHEMLTEALHRRRVEPSEGTRFAEHLLGVCMHRAQYERGAAFVDGVMERAGEAGLRRLWSSERELPTTAEIDAPGLWLARIDLPE